MNNLILLYTILILFGCKKSNETNSIAEKITVDSISKISMINEVPFVEKNNSIQIDTLVKVSKPFVINNVNCYWKFTVYLNNEIQGGNGTLELIGLDNKQALLTDGENEYYELNASYYTHSFNGISFEQLNDESIKDINFDGYNDFMLYSRVSSGSGGEFYKVYLFDNKTELFKFSKELSGGYLTINNDNRSLLSSWKNGAGNYTERVHYFDKTGKIKFTEIITNEIIWGDTLSLLKKSYKKIIEGKVVKTKIETLNYESH